MPMIPCKVASCDIDTTKPTARTGRGFFSCLLEAIIESYLRQEHHEIARYQHLKGRQLTDNVALDTERRALPNL
jgi:hypothetical protein